ncbi:MAG: hypothetical protein AB2A00_42165 [Myxococcota bacterium]
MNRVNLLLLTTTAAVLGACDCRPVPPNRWSDLGIQCNGQSDFARNAQRSDQVVLETQQQFEDFLRRDCLRGQTSITVPRVDFGKRVVIIDGTFSPLEDGTCVKTRKVAQVDACVGGVQMLYDDTPDPECSAQLLTGSISIDRDEARSAFSAQSPAVAAAR